MFQLGTTTVTYVFSDDNNNSSTCSFTVTVVDNTAPVISDCPANITVNTALRTTCDQTATWTAPTATDNCTTPVHVSSSHNPGDVFQLGTTTVTYVFSDDNNNSSTCSFTVTVVDNTAPVISDCPANITVNTALRTTCDQTATWTAPTATDNCTTPVHVSSSHNPGDVFQSGTTTVTYVFSDDNNNSSTCSFTVTVVDNTAPVISDCPANITVNTALRTTCDQTATWTAPTATDNCTTPVHVSSSHSPGDVFQLGTTTVTYVFSDDNNNSSTCSFTVTVVDNTAPVISDCPANITVNTALRTTCDQTATWTAPTATDNCTTPVHVSSSHNPGDVFQLGTTTVTYVFSDDNNNSSTCSFTVTVVDNTAPVISDCPANITVNTGVAEQPVTRQQHGQRRQQQIIVLRLL